MLPLQATADESKLIKRVIHERFAELKRMRRQKETLEIYTDSIPSRSTCWRG